jgi:NhaC family Na+:H+ antiporter
MSEIKKPGILLSFVPVVILMSLLVLNILLYKDDATGGANQIALLIAAAVSVAIGLFTLKHTYKDLEEHIIASIQMAMQANVILLVVGALIGTWILSGIVPAMIYYGLKLINPGLFLPVACVVCAIVALATGSSWSTTGTVGIALIGIGKTLGVPEGMVAGAIISGAYFGDKMSPLSDTTNLAPAMAGAELFEHIKHMLYTTIPSITISIIGFLLLGFFYGQGEIVAGNIDTVFQTIESNFNIGIHLFIVPAIVLYMVYRKVPALPALVVGTTLGGVSALVFQTELLTKMAGGTFDIAKVYQVIVTTSYSGFTIETGNTLIDSLFNRGGMSGMLNTVWLILCAMIFGGALEGTGMLQQIAGSILKLVRGAGSLVGATIGSCLLVNMTACDQYLAIVVPGRMFRKAYENFGLKAKNLSRALEDSGTVTSVLIPWNSGGAYNAGVLGVATTTYLPYCFFNILSPIISSFLAGFHISLEKIEEN